MWRKLAEVVEKYVHKGDKLYIEGRVRYSTYDDKQGQRRYMTEIWADNMEMLTPKANSNTGAVVNEPAPAPQGEESGSDNQLPF